MEQTDSKPFYFFIMPWIVIILAFLILGGLKKLKKPPRKKEIPRTGILVETQRCTKTDVPLWIESEGELTPKRKVIVSAEVSGLVSWIAPELREGAFFKKDDLLFRIEKADHENEVIQAESLVADIQLEKIRIEHEAKLAKSEWNMAGSVLSKEEKQSPSSLLLYEPQLNKVEYALKAALSNLEEKKRKFEKTAIKAPFDCRILTKDVEFGTFLRVGDSTLSLIGTEMFEVKVAMSDSDRKWIQNPSQLKEPSKVILSIENGIAPFELKGFVSHILPLVNPMGRRPQVVIAIPKPFDQIKPKEKLMVGQFVHVRMQGETLKQVIVLPGRALREDKTVYVVDSENRIRLQKVKVSRFEKETIYIADGLKEGDQVVLSLLTGVSEGVLVRVLEDEPSQFQNQRQRKSIKSR